MSAADGCAYLPSATRAMITSRIDRIALNSRRSRPCGSVLYNRVSTLAAGLTSGVPILPVRVSMMRSARTPRISPSSVITVLPLSSVANTFNAPSSDRYPALLISQFPTQSRASRSLCATPPVPCYDVSCDFAFFLLSDRTSYILRPIFLYRPSRLTCPRPSEEVRSEEHTSELQSRLHLVCRLLLAKKVDEERRRGRVRGEELWPGAEPVGV